METGGKYGSGLFIKRGMAQDLEVPKEILGGNRPTFSSGSRRSGLPFPVAVPA
jgi:hypothetical protein